MESFMIDIAIFNSGPPEQLVLYLIGQLLTRPIICSIKNTLNNNNASCFISFVIPVIYFWLKNILRILQKELMIGVSRYYTCLTIRDSFYEA